MVSKPTWMYKPVHVNNLEQIKKEFENIYKQHYSNIFKDRGFAFTYLDKDIVRDNAPIYIQFLKDLKLYDKWTSCIFVGTSGDKRLVDSPIHVDTEDWQSRSYALNLPVMNCENSYTVFYNASKPNAQAYFGDEPVTGWATARGFDFDGAIEIGRWNVEQPAWINVCIPHRAENNNPNTRLIVSSRFWPEIHEYFDDTNN